MKKCDLKESCLDNLCSGWLKPFVKQEDIAEIKCYKPKHKSDLKDERKRAFIAFLFSLYKDKVPGSSFVCNTQSENESTLQSEAMEHYQRNPVFHAICDLAIQIAKDI